MEKNFMLQGATKLSKNEMKNVKGGVSEEEHCRNLYEIATNNFLDEGAQEGLSYAWSEFNCNRFDYN
ncbi:MAG: hypothetical protein BWZ00_01582 [Bacteroidetes bacterium ADurb.BinA174]|nr:MAG: hypothetical protein BWZ00_01582 [Bacteroidetes bacterium ADurb.BinA174]